MLPAPSLSQIASAHGLDLVVLFGSRAKGRARPDSDVDVAVRCARGPLDLDARLDVAEALRTVYDADVDVVDLLRADPLLQKQIFSCGQPLFEEPGCFYSARLQAFHRYQDYRPFLTLERRAVRRALGLDAG